MICEECALTLMNNEPHSHIDDYRRGIDDLTEKYQIISVNPDNVKYVYGNCDVCGVESFEFFELETVPN